MWQICGHVPQTLITEQPDITCLAAQLSTSFFIETFIHAKEKVFNFVDFIIIIFSYCNNMFQANYGTMGRVANKAI